MRAIPHNDQKRGPSVVRSSEADVVAGGPGPQRPLGTADRTKDPERTN